MPTDATGAGSSRPFLEVLTRSYRRPAMLAVNQATLRLQTDRDFTQTVLVDEAGRGIGWAQARLADYAPQLVGRYVWVLDDDDLCLHRALVAELKAIAAREEPDVVMLRMDHGPLGVLPAETWAQGVAHGRQGCSSYVVRRELFQRHADAWRSACYHSDYDFIRAVWDGEGAALRVVWHDVVASAVQRISYGEPAL